MDDYSELRSLIDLRSAVAAQCRIVISDETKSAPTVHHPDCGHVREENFLQKVIENKGDFGRYFQARNTGIAEEHGAVCCRHCYG